MQTKHNVISFHLNYTVGRQEKNLRISSNKMKWLLYFAFEINFFQGKREGKVNYNKDLSCFPRHTLLVTFTKESKTVLDAGFHAVDCGF